MNPENKIYLSPVGGALAAICFFLPWVKVECAPSASSGADIGGIVWLVLIAALVIIGSFFFYKNQNQLEQSKKIIRLSSWSAFAVLIIRYITFASSDYGKMGFTLQFGVFGTIIGFIGALVGTNYIESKQIIKKAKEVNKNQAQPAQNQEIFSQASASAQTYRMPKPPPKPNEISQVAQKLMNKINSFDYAGEYKKYKKGIIIGVASFFILLIAYNIFFVTSPVIDGRKAGEQYIKYQNSLLQDKIKAYNDFINNYDSYKFSFKSQAYDKLNEISNQSSTMTNALFTKQNDIYSKLRNRYINEPEKLNKFDNAYSMTIGSNNNTELQTQQSNFYSQIQNKISLIIPAEPDTNKIKNDLLGKSFTKGRTSWRFQFLSETLRSEIINVVRSNNYREYNIEFTLYDSNSGDTFKAKMIISYNFNGDNWAIANSTMTDLEDITKKIKY